MNNEIVWTWEVLGCLGSVVQALADKVEVKGLAWCVCGHHGYDWRSYGTKVSTTIFLYFFSW